MTNGFRSQPQPTKKEQQRKMEVELQNLQMSTRVSQLMIQQLMQSVSGMRDDLNKAMNHLYELQYKYLAVQRHLNLDVDALNKIANDQRLKDFEEAAAKADAQENLEVADVVSEESTVVITSVALDANGEDKGIFRSRFKLSESGIPDLNSSLLGKRPGDKVKVTLNGLQHEVELLAVRNPKPAESKQAQSVAEITH